MIFKFSDFGNTFLILTNFSPHYADDLHLWDSGDNFIAILSGNNFTIPSQQVSGPYYATGNGNITSNVITYQTSGDVYLNKGKGPKQ